MPWDDRKIDDGRRLVGGVFLSAFLHRSCLRIYFAVSVVMRAVDSPGFRSIMPRIEFADIFPQIIRQAASHDDAVSFFLRLLDCLCQVRSFDELHRNLHDVFFRDMYDIESIHCKHSKSRILMTHSSEIYVFADVFKYRE